MKIVCFIVALIISMTVTATGSAYSKTEDVCIHECRLSFLSQKDEIEELIERIEHLEALQMHSAFSIFRRFDGAIIYDVPDELLKEDAELWEAFGEILSGEGTCLCTIERIKSGIYCFSVDMGEDIFSERNEYLRYLKYSKIDFPDNCPGQWAEKWIFSRVSQIPFNSAEDEESIDERKLSFLSQREEIEALIDRIEQLDAVQENTKFTIEKHYDGTTAHHVAKVFEENKELWMACEGLLSRDETCYYLIQRSEGGRYSFDLYWGVCSPSAKVESLDYLKYSAMDPYYQYSEEWAENWVYNWYTFEE